MLILSPSKEFDQHYKRSFSKHIHRSLTKQIWDYKTRWQQTISSSSIAFHKCLNPDESEVFQGSEHKSALHTKFAKWHQARPSGLLLNLSEEIIFYHNVLCSLFCNNHLHHKNIILLLYIHLGSQQKSLELVCESFLHLLEHHHVMDFVVGHTNLSFFVSLNSFSLFTAIRRDRSFWDCCSYYCSIS